MWINTPLDDLRTTSDVLEILAGLYLPEPEKKDVDRLLHVRIPADRELNSQILELCKLRAELGDEFYERFLDEYVLLFYTKKPVPFYESVYVDVLKIQNMKIKGLIMGESTQKVLDFYRSCELDISERFKEPPDHIGVELAFLSYLTKAFLRDPSEELLQKQRDFLELHVMRWVPDFCRSILNLEGLTFYPVVAALTNRILTIYSNILSSLKSMRDRGFLSS